MFDSDLEQESLWVEFWWRVSGWRLLRLPALLGSSTAIPLWKSCLPEALDEAADLDERPAAAILRLFVEIGDGGEVNSRKG